MGFKVIVVGGGPVGLVAAHALSRADIDFVLLESRPSIVLDAGSNLVINPMGLRVLGQLGLLPAFDAVSSPLAQIERLDHNGRDLGNSQAFVHISEKYDICFPRSFVLHTLTSSIAMAAPSEPSAATILPLSSTTHSRMRSKPKCFLTSAFPTFPLQIMM